MGIHYLLTKKSIELMEEALSQLTGEIHYKEVIKILQEKFDITGEIIKMIYSSTMFEVNKETGKTEISQNRLKKIKQYTNLKNLIFNSKDKTTEKVKLEELLSFIEQVKQKQQIYELQEKHGVLYDIRSKKEIYRDNLFELQIHCPDKLKGSIQERNSDLEVILNAI